MISNQDLNAIKTKLFYEIKDEGDQYIASNLESMISNVGPEEGFYLIGQMYFFGHEASKVRVDRKMAFECFKISSDFGYSPAKVQLISMLHSDILGDGTLKYIHKLADESYKYLLAEANNGSHEAQYQLGTFIFYQYMKRDLELKERYIEAIRWYEKSAHQNFSPALKAVQYTKALLEGFE
jgi:TPR repeat protein